MKKLILLFAIIALTLAVNIRKDQSPIDSENGLQKNKIIKIGLERREVTSDKKRENFEFVKMHQKYLYGNDEDFFANLKYFLIIYHKVLMIHLNKKLDKNYNLKLIQNKNSMHPLYKKYLKESLKNPLLEFNQKLRKLICTISKILNSSDNLPWLTHPTLLTYHYHH